MTITESDFVLARLAEKERTVEVPDWYCTDSARGEGWGSRGDECPACGRYMFDGTEVATEDGWENHMADVHGDVLAQCAAMRKIVELRESAQLQVEKVGGDPTDPFAITFRSQVIAFDATLRALASIWSDHPEFDPAWKV